MAVEFGSVLGGLFSGAIGVMAIIMVIFLIFGLVAFAFWYFFYHKKKYDITVKIQSERVGDPRILFDKGAILYDRNEKAYYLKLMNTKRIEIEIPKFNVIHRTNKGDYIELLRKSEMDFRFLTPPIIRKDIMVTKNGKIIPVGQMEQRQIENDVAWIIGRSKKNKSIIDPASILGVLLQHLPAIISGVMSLMVLYLIFQNAPALLSAMQSAADRFERVNPPETATVIGSLISIATLKWKKKT